MKLVKLNREGGVLNGVLDDVKVIMIIAIIVGMTPAIVVTVLGAFNVTLPEAWQGGLQAPGLWVTSSLLIGAVVTIGLVSRIFPALNKLGGRKKNNR
ncbi:MAG: hypothetical protein KBS54_04380 [Synergistaceae bacterium]|nr:hypothetical protein [Candidatus Equadaptatus faecalis]